MKRFCLLFAAATLSVLVTSGIEEVRASMLTGAFSGVTAFDAEGDAAHNTGDGPRFAFEWTKWDFGDIPHKTARAECEFPFTNDGDKPLVITKIITSCSCLKAEYGKKPVMPGESAVIKMVYEVNKKEPGVFYKVVEVYSNTAEKRTNLIIKGNAVK